MKRPLANHVSPPAVPHFAGIHLSGPNAHKTAVAVLAGDLRLTPLRIAKVYEKIGAYGTLFSDERVVQIIAHHSPLAKVFVDCPLSLPPCVACQRPSCPGAVQCDDVSVAYMMALSQKVRRRGARKARPVNPQSQRLWDVLQLGQEEQENRLEPSFSANMAPLVARARTLQRRLNAVEPYYILEETNLSLAIPGLHSHLQLNLDTCQSYRSFETGFAARTTTLAALQRKGWFTGSLTEGEQDQLTRSVEVFQALLTALVAACDYAGMTHKKPATWSPEEGWVVLPVAHVPHISDA